MTSIYITKEQIDETLRSTPTLGKKLLEPLKSLAEKHKLPFNILENQNVNDNIAEIHHETGDLWHCLEGECVFVHGGEMVDPLFKENADGTKDEKEVRAKSIINGTEVVLKAGDWLWIPPGQPHVHNQPEGTTRLVVIKIPKKN